jgi:hypothetical protein
MLELKLLELMLLLMGSLLFQLVALLKLVLRVSFLLERLDTQVGETFIVIPLFRSLSLHLRAIYLRPLILIITFPGNRTFSNFFQFLFQFAFGTFYGNHIGGINTYLHTCRQFND